MTVDSGSVAAVQGGHVKARDTGCELSTIRRAGMLIPCTNTTIEIEFNRILPKQYQLHVGRLRMGPIDEAGWKMQDADIDYQADLLRTAGVELIILAQTGAVYFADDYDAAVTRRMREASGAPAFTAGHLVGKAATALGARRIAFVSPYSAHLNELGARYYKSVHGVEMAVVESFGNPSTSAEVGLLKAEAATAAIARANRPEVQAFVVAGGNFPTMSLIAGWEREFGKPVITTNQCSMWAILGMLGAGEA